MADDDDATGTEASNTSQNDYLSDEIGLENNNGDEVDNVIPSVRRTTRLKK